MTREELEAEVARLQAALAEAGIEAKRLTERQVVRDHQHIEDLTASQRQTIAANQRTFHAHSQARDAAERHRHLMAEAVADLSASQDAVAKLNVMQAKLAASEARQRAIFDNAADIAMIVTSPAGIVTDWNIGAENILGWTVDEMRGETAERFFTQGDLAAGRVQSEMAEAINNGRAADERWHLRKGGERFWASGEMLSLVDDHDVHIGFVKILRDRTRQHLDGAALQLSEAVARQNVERVQLALAAGAIIGTWHWDLPSDQFTVDEGFARAFGLDPALGREGISLAQIVATVHPDDQAGLAAAIDAVIVRGGPYAHQYRVRRLDGRYYWIEANGRVDHAPNGTPLSFPGVLIDVEGRRAVEAERDRATAALRTLTDTLEQRVVDRTAELMQAEERLRQSQKMEAIGQLTGGVAHDFNNLLTVIRGSVDLLRRDNVPAEKRQRYLDAIGDTADRAAKLTGQLLAFARRQTLEPEVFEVGQRLDGITDMLDSITGTRVLVRFELPETSCRVRADVSQFETALVNLAVNARDAMDGQGTVTIRLQCDARMPSIRGHGPSSGDFVAISLSDTGVGIAPDDLERIFEPFFTTKDIGKGTGLGLSQVFGFAKQSGGDVDVESIVGRGSTFTLYLPQADSTSSAESSSAVPSEDIDGEGRCVLVVEDNISVGQFATQLLEDLGYETKWVTSAEEALKSLGDDGNGFDIVFSDVVMPGMGGIELAKRLAQNLPNMPVILASGYSHVLAQEGVDGIELLRKPYSGSQLSGALQRRMAWARRQST